MMSNSVHSDPLLAIAKCLAASGLRFPSVCTFCFFYTVHMLSYKMVRAILWTALQGGAELQLIQPEIPQRIGWKGWYCCSSFSRKAQSQRALVIILPSRATTSLEFRLFIPKQSARNDEKKHSSNKRCATCWNFWEHEDLTWSNAADWFAPGAFYPRLLSICFAVPTMPVDCRLKDTSQCLGHGQRPCL